MSKQLAQGCYPSRIVAWPGCEPLTSQPESQSVKHYATDTDYRYTDAGDSTGGLNESKQIEVLNVA